MIKTCPQCNREFKPPTKIGKAKVYCSKECYIQSKLRQVEKICEACGKNFTIMASTDAHRSIRYCSMTCRASTRIELTCAYCERTFYIKHSHAPLRKTCSRQCAARLRAAEGRSPKVGKSVSPETRQQISQKMSKYYQQNPAVHPWYIDGSYAQGELKRGPSWNTQRKLARERDHHTCQMCGKTREQLGKNLSVHHIIAYRHFASSEEANALSNLISLCQSCHMKREHSG